MNIGFIGLGVMGRPMVGHLIDAGHTLFLHRVKEVSRFLVEKGGKAVDSPRAVAEQTDVIILMVPDTPDVEQVLFGENGVASGLEPGKLVIDMSSISPVATKQFAAKIEKLGCDYLDAPVSGGEVGAKAASLTIMVGGKEEVSSAQSRSSRSLARTSRWSAARATGKRRRSQTRSSLG